MNVVNLALKHTNFIRKMGNTFYSRSGTYDVKSSTKEKMWLSNGRGKIE